MLRKPNIFVDMFIMHEEGTYRGMQITTAAHPLHGFIYNLQTEPRHVQLICVIQGAMRKQLSLIAAGN